MQKSSFTLIEILVTVGIILLLSGTALASFGRFNDDKQIEKEVDQVEALLQQIKQTAQSPQKTSVCTANFLSYSVRFSGSNNSTVDVYSFCQNGVAIDSELLNTYLITSAVRSVSINTYDGFSLSPIQLISFRPHELTTYTSTTFASSPVYTPLNGGSTIQIKFVSSSGKVCDFIAINSVGAIKKQTKVNCTATHIDI